MLLPSEGGVRWTPLEGTSLDFTALLRGNKKGVVQPGSQAASPVLLLLLGAQEGLHSPYLSPVAPPVTSSVGPSAWSVSEQWHNCAKPSSAPLPLFATRESVFRACLAKVPRWQASDKGAQAGTC